MAISPNTNLFSTSPSPLSPSPLSPGLIQGEERSTDASDAFTCIDQYGSFLPAFGKRNTLIERTASQAEKALGLNLKKIDIL